MNTATSETEIEMMVKPISPAPFGGFQRHALLDVAVDVFQHDDGVIDHEAHRDGQRHQRQVVEAVADHVHHRGRAHDGQRHGDDGISVAATLRRNTKITITTSAMVSTRVNSTSSTEARMVWVRSIRY
jgi:hypothetical protein